MLYLGTAGTRKQAITWINEIMPDLPEALVAELADLSDKNQLMVRDPKMWDGRIDANDDTAPRVREIVSQYNSKQYDAGVTAGFDEAIYEVKRGEIDPQTYQRKT